MLSSTALTIATVLAVSAAWVLGMFYIDVFTPEDVKAWRRLASLRSYEIRRNRVEQLLTRTNLVDRIAHETDLNRLLAISNRTETPLAFIAKAISYGAVVAGGALVADVLLRASTGDWAITPLVAFLVGGVVTALMFARLRSEVQRRQNESDLALGDMLMLIAVLTEGRGLQLDDAIKILARCTSSGALQAIVDQGGWRRLVRKNPRTTVEQYRLVGEAYGVPMFEQLADALANANVGFAERDTYVRLAKAVYAHRLTDARQWAARAKTLVTFPVAGMLIPLLILLGAPTLSQLAGSLR